MSFGNISHISYHALQSKGLPNNTTLIYCKLPDIPTSHSAKEIETQTGRALLFSWIKNNFGLSITETDLVYKFNGKPFLSDRMQEKLRLLAKDGGKWPVYFNISHSEEYVVCAISFDEVGCDIQKIRPLRDSLFRHLEAFDHVNGLDIKSLSSEQKIEIWVRYESFGKLLGVGIPFDVTRYESEIIGGNFQWWVSHELPGYVAALCYRKRE